MVLQPQPDNRAAKKGALVLAAGYSKRFGGSKLTAILDNGNTVFQQTLQKLSAATENILIVTRTELIEDGLFDTGICHFDSLRRHAFTHSANAASPDSTIRVALCEDSNLGMGHTLAFGISQITGWDACLVCLGDMPFVRTATYQQLLAELTTDNIVVAEYHGATGNPVGFGKNYFAELQKVSGDTGGRELIRRNSHHLVKVTVNDNAVLQDIDTREDLTRFQ